MSLTKKISIPELYSQFEKFKEFDAFLQSESFRLKLSGLAGSAFSVYVATYFHANKDQNVVVLPDKEAAAYFYNDLENLLGEVDVDLERKSVLFFPNSYKSINNLMEADRLNLMSRAEVLERISNGLHNTLIVTYSEAIAEKSAIPKDLKKNNFRISIDKKTNLDDLYNYLVSNGYVRKDFVLEPGQFSLRGSIIDIYSYNNEYPYRIEFFDDDIESVRVFNPVDQLSLKEYKNVNIIPANFDELSVDKKSIIECLPSKTKLWFSDFDSVVHEIDSLEEFCMEYQGDGIYGSVADKDIRVGSIEVGDIDDYGTESDSTESDSTENDDIEDGGLGVGGLDVDAIDDDGIAVDNVDDGGIIVDGTTVDGADVDEDDPNNSNITQKFILKSEFLKSILDYKTIFYGSNNLIDVNNEFRFDVTPQISVNKSMEVLSNYLVESILEGKSIFICSESESQIERIKRIIEEISKDNPEVSCTYLKLSLHGGYNDNDNFILMLTDHQLFNRYHKYKLKDKFDRRLVNIIKDIESLKPGDYVTHIDHGIGRYDGLEKIENNGKVQEALRIVYANNDLLYVNINALSRISKYSSSEGHEPKLNKLGSSAWTKLKNRTKSKVKDIAEDLIKLYAKRLDTKGFAFSRDTYLQNELEASFMYEDTPDQVNATIDVKNDMEKDYPMERLICGDVGFGKTEIAIRAAFKAVVDSKQVVVLVPTTILAFQHYQTFSERLADFPVTVDYINRFKTAKQRKEIIEDIKSGRIDILIGTHAVLNKEFIFKDLGLLIVDEEQKFGVSAKEKLKNLKVNVDTLTLTATPIPRTLQFSLMGARDLSILRTPPPNRMPVQTEVCVFDDIIIRNAIEYEINRGGQVYFVHNRVQNILAVEDTLKRIVSGISIEVAHGQMAGDQLEKTMLNFMEGHFDVLLCTKIIESGLDIPNVNTIIINGANNFGLSELHQLRGRVGRSDRKAFCYLITPPMHMMTEDAKKRIKAVEEFSDLGSGLNIAMRDLDIRGAGNILGAEQSGFISDIGFDMYQKILNEALSELKSETDYRTAENSLSLYEYSNDCKIDIDEEALIPDKYVTDNAERMRLYQEMALLKSNQDFENFKNKLQDRFGKIPDQVEKLIEVLKIKLKAQELGVERIYVKNNILKCYFISAEHAAFYKSDIFMKVIEFVKENPKMCKIGDKDGQLTLEFFKPKNTEYASDILFLDFVFDSVANMEYSQ
ncbi:MAG: transcription-repair coupling factor [Bacteroidales bacterium]|jgi:transcription-repair coupling factor (superfamily II helicase)